MLSSDAFADAGVIAQGARAQGYDAVLLTDHNLGSSFPISNDTANNARFDDTYLHWTPATSGTLTSQANDLATAPVFAGTGSMHLKATSATAGEVNSWKKRGPSLRAGTTSLTFSVYPVRVDPGSGLYVSASLGGDPTVTSPYGYTTRDGVVHPARSITIVYQLGTARQPSFDPERRVLTIPLGLYQLNQWNTYTVNLNNAIAALPASEQPIDTNGFAYLKMAAAANNGTAEAYFDSFSATPSAPEDPGAEFVYRNSVLPQFSTSAFRLYPSLEEGISKHAQRFNFGITSPSDFVAYKNGIDGIATTQATGYPAQLNHPGDDGGASAAESIATQGEGADLTEIRLADYRAVWDSILSQGTQILGSLSTDNHRSESPGSFSTHVYAGSVGFDDLIRGLYEGRSFGAVSRFTGDAIFNLDASSSDPYPTRYPVYVPASATAADVHLRLTSVPAGSSLRWIRNGVLMDTETPSASYDRTRSIPLSSDFTYVRAELLAGDGSVVAATQPIFFRPVGNLPAQFASFGATGVATPSNTGYTRTTTKGVTGVSWDLANQRLSATLQNPGGALTTVLLRSPTVPQQVVVDGQGVAQAASLAAFDASNAAAWYYEPGHSLLHVKAAQGLGTSTLAVDLGTTSGNQPPSIPTLTSADARGAHAAHLVWSPSSDDVGVSAYNVRRDGAVVARLGAGQTSFDDSGLAAGTNYSYTVEAFDGAGAASGESQPRIVTTATLGQLTISPAADAYTQADKPSTNTGTATTFRADGSPINVSYLSFDVTGVPGAIDKATLRLHNNSTSSIPYRVHSVADNSWGERTITSANAPAFDPTAVVQSGAFSAGSTSALDVTPLVTGNGPVSMALDTTNAAGMSWPSRESTTVSNRPTLTIDYVAPPPNAPPSVPTITSATATGTDGAQIGWTPATDDLRVAGYVVRRDGAIVATLAPDVTTFTDSALTPGTTYSYTVDAFDDAGAHSDQSAAAPVTTQLPPTNTPPSPPTLLSAVATGQTGAQLEWTESSDDVGVAGYVVKRDGATVATLGPTATAFTDSGLAPATTYRYTVEAFDGPGAHSDPSAELPVTTDANTAPTAPTITRAVAAGAGGAAIDWSASSDDVSVSGYVVRRDDAVVASPGAGTRTFTDSGLTPGATYSYTVEAVDDQGIHSARSAARSVTTDSTQTASFAPVADAYVSTDKPTTNYGTVTTLRADASPIYTSYLRFDVSGITGTVQKATLRVFDNSTATLGQRVHGVADNSWGERTITLSNAPPMGPVVSSGPQAAGTWSTLDVTPLVTGSGTVSFGLDTTSSTAMSWASREASANPPELRIEYAARANQPPSAPSITSATASGQHGAAIAWSASQDLDGSIAGYVVKRDGAVVASPGPAATSFADSGLAASTSYSYTVEAIDDRGAHSDPSSAASVTTDAPSPPPAAPVITSAAASGPHGAAIAWSDDDPAVAGYVVKRDGAVVATPGAGTSTFADSGLAAATTYSYTVEAVNSESTHSLPSDAASVTTADPAPPPAVPVITSAVADGPHGAAIAWSDDDPAVAGYVVKRDDAVEATPGAGTTTFTDSRLAPATTYSYTVEAVNSDGVHSNSSDKAVVTTDDQPLNQPPSTPSITSATASGPHGASIVWSASADLDGSVAGYVVKRDGAVVASPGPDVTSFADSGLAPSTTYSYTVEAVDDGSVHSSPSDPRSVTTATPTTVSFAPAADAYLSSEKPTTNYGTLTTLRADGSPVYSSYVRFDVSGLSGPVEQATVRVFNTTAASGGQRVHPVTDNSWTERGITFANAPIFGPVVNSSPTQAAGTWTDLDVTGLIAGNGSVSLALDTVNTTARTWPSREASANAPQLRVVYDAP